MKNTNQRLIRNLQQKVQSQSVNSLKNIYPDDIVDWLGISKSEAKEFIDDLYDKRIISYKYRLKCNCGEVCTIYEKRLARDMEMCCPVCGQDFGVEDIRKKATIAYEIDKEELMHIEEENVDFKVLPHTKGKVVLIPQKQEEKKMEIFIGSSSEAKEYMDEIAAKLEEFGAAPLLWNASGKRIFIPGVSTIDSLIKITQRVGAAVFIFNADDKIWNEKSALETSNAVRDNVLFEYGLFMGALGKGKVCFVCKGNPKIASDLKGITYINGDDGEFQVKLKLRDWINEIKNM